MELVRVAGLVAMTLLLVLAAYDALPAPLPASQAFSVSTTIPLSR